MLNSTKVQGVEVDYHKLLYINLLLLNKVHPPSNEFIKVFDLNMFRRNNKKAFQEVIYYLFQVISPERIREKISTWPLADREIEDNFRKEVLLYVNEIRENNPDFNIPNIMVSHLLSPGGIIFVKFMYKLSQFALFQYINRNKVDDAVLLPIKYEKDEDIKNQCLQNLEHYNSNLQASIETAREEFQAFKENCVRKAEEITQQTNEANEELRKFKHFHENKVKNCNIIVNYEAIQTRLDRLQHKLNNLERISQLSELFRVAMLNLLNGNCVIKYDKNKTKLPKNVVEEDGQLNLLRLFNYFKWLLHQQIKDLPIITTDQIAGMMKMIDEMISVYECIQESVGYNEEILRETQNKLQTLKEC